MFPPCSLAQIGAVWAPGRAAGLRPVSAVSQPPAPLTGSHARGCHGAFLGQRCHLPGLRPGAQWVPEASLFCPPARPLPGPHAPTCSRAPPRDARRLLRAADGERGAISSPRGSVFSNGPSAAARPDDTVRACPQHPLPGVPGTGESAAADPSCCPEVAASSQHRPGAGAQPWGRGTTGFSEAGGGPPQHRARGRPTGAPTAIPPPGLRQVHVQMRPVTEE